MELFLNIKTKNKKIKKYNNSFFEGIASSFNFGTVLINQVNDGASYEYLNHIKEDNNYYLLFRLYGDGLNYHKHLIKEDGNELIIIDTYVYLTGEFISETFKTLYTSLLISEGLLSKKDKTDSDAFEDLKKVKVIKTLLAEGNFELAEKVYNEISEKSKKQKLYKVIGLQLFSNLSEEKYNKVISDYEKEFPNDISLYLISIDGYIIKENYEKALTSIDKLDELIGGDKFLDYLRGNIYYLQSNLSTAEKYFVKVSENYPEFIDSYDSLLTVYVEQDNTEAAINVLNVMVNDFYLPKDIFFESLQESFPEFSEKEEVIKWSKE